MRVLLLPFKWMTMIPAIVVATTIICFLAAAPGIKCSNGDDNSFRDNGDEGSVLLAMEFFPIDKLISSAFASPSPSSSIYLFNNTTMNITINNGTTNTNGTDTNNNSDTTADNVFWVIIKSIYFNAFASGLFAGLVTILITVVIEKFGPQVGGVLGTLPSTIIPATIGFSIEANKNFGNDHSELKQHMLIQQFFVIPLAVFCNCLFLVVWKYSPHLIDRIWNVIIQRKERSVKKRTSSTTTDVHDDHFESHHEMHDEDDHHHPSIELLADTNDVEHKMKDSAANTVTITSAATSPTLESSVSSSGSSSRKYSVGKMFIVMTLSLIVWFTLAIIIVTVTKVVKLEDYILMILSGIFFLFMVLISVICNWRPSCAKSGPPKKVAWWLILSRGLFTFCVIGISVILSGLHLTLVSGLLSVFPAIFLTSMVSLWLSQNEQAAINAASSMMIGTSSLPVFSVVVCVCLWYMNVAFAILIAFAVSTVIAGLVYAFLYWRRRATTPKSSGDAIAATAAVVEVPSTSSIIESEKTISSSGVTDSPAIVEESSESRL